MSSRLLVQLQSRYCLAFSGGSSHAGSSVAAGLVPSGRYYNRELGKEASRRAMSSSAFLYEGREDSAGDLVEIMRRIIGKGGRGRTQDNIPKEVGAMDRALPTNYHTTVLMFVVCCTLQVQVVLYSQY